MKAQVPIWKTEEEGIAIASFIVALQGALINLATEEPGAVFPVDGLISILEHCIDRQDLRRYVDMVHDALDAR